MTTPLMGELLTLLRDSRQHLYVLMAQAANYSRGGPQTDAELKAHSLIATLTRMEKDLDSCVIVPLHWRSTLDDSLKESFDAITR